MVPQSPRRFVVCSFITRSLGVSLDVKGEACGNDFHESMQVNVSQCKSMTPSQDNCTRARRVWERPTPQGAHVPPAPSIRQARLQDGPADAPRWPDRRRHEGATSVPPLRPRAREHHALVHAAGRGPQAELGPSPPAAASISGRAPTALCEPCSSRRTTSSPRTSPTGGC